MGGGGGLNCEAKAQVLVVTPPPLFFLKVGRKKGGRNSGAVRYFHMELLTKSITGKERTQLYDKPVVALFPQINGFFYSVFKRVRHLYPL